MKDELYSYDISIENNIRHLWGPRRTVGYTEPKPTNTIEEKIELGMKWVFDGYPIIFPDYYTSMHWKILLERGRDAYDIDYNEKTL